MANSTGSLEELSIAGARVQNAILRKLAIANPHLENVYFKSHDLIEADEEYCALYMVDLISCFAGCPKLRILSFRSAGINVNYKLRAIHDACVQLRHRSVSVRLNDVEYI